MARIQPGGSPGARLVEPKARQRASASPRGGVRRKLKAKSQGDEQESDMRRDAFGTSGHVTAKSSIFDRVNHDRLMVRLRKHLDAPDVLKLINRFLKGGVQVDGQTQATIQGVPQEAPCRRCWPTWCWTNWTGHWNAKATDLPAMPMTATSLSKANVRASGSCKT